VKKFFDNWFHNYLFPFTSYNFCLKHFFFHFCTDGFRHSVYNLYIIICIYVYIWIFYQSKWLHYVFCIWISSGMAVSRKHRGAAQANRIRYYVFFISFLHNLLTIKRISLPRFPFHDLWILKFRHRWNDDIDIYIAYARLFILRSKNSD